MNTLQSIYDWHTLARPEVEDKHFQVQLGCHFEEMAEMIEALRGNDPVIERKLQDAFSALESIATDLKSGSSTVNIHDRQEFIDSIADQIVTGIGAAYCAKMDPVLAATRVDSSNWSKFVRGKPVFDHNGKIAKPPTYRSPDLEGCF